MTEAADVGIEAGAEAFDLLGATGEVIGNVATPVILAMKVGKAISDDPEEQMFAAGITGTATTIGMFTPAAPFIALGATAWAGWSFLNWCIDSINKPSYR